jgi:hypothetical protein
MASSRLSAVVASGSVSLLVAQPPKSGRSSLLVAVCTICGGKARIGARK